MVNLFDYLSSNSYPGRGVAIGKSADGENAILVYFIMGRSVNSRNRIFVESEGGIKTKAFDESKLTDPSLIIYAPVRIYDNNTIVTNGDQTDTIYDGLQKNKTFADALRTRCFEPDEPNFTPRISGIAIVKNGRLSYKLSILKKSFGMQGCDRFFYEYENTFTGIGHIIHTYKADGNPIPSFEGEPVLFAIDKDFDKFSDDVWNALNADNKVSLFVRSISLKNGAVKTKIYNKHI
ncbi:MAG: inosine monophosphate cyclohydrolase [Clostridiales bacterium GWF2_36_10]|nr:MAG: inosine monophosphate cyclohydrolase [Clostridiales bacterium GWF2_36_10]HAN21150.1 inosine monophosphate cyclohydrolase [Clostridiales bacterium]